MPGPNVRTLGLSPGQILDAIARYAGSGGTGPRLYDFLIGSVALAHGIGAMVTWNVRDLRPLFPVLLVQTPDT